MAKGTKTISWVSGKGSEISLTLNYESIYHPEELIEGGWEGIRKETIYASKETSITISGKTYNNCGSVREITDNLIRSYGKDLGKSMEQALGMGCKYFVGFHDHQHNNGKYMAFFLSNCPFDEIQAAWETLIAETDDADVKRMKNAEAAAERQTDLSRAEHIMSLEDVTRKYFKGKLPNSTELKAWEKKYNDLHNEGGEGYIPELVTNQQVEWAEKMLVEVATSASK